MNKLIELIIRRRICFFLLPVVLLFLHSGNTAAEIMSLTNFGGLVNETLTINGVYSQNTGVVNYGQSFGSSGSYEWKTPGSLVAGSYNYVGPQAFKGSFSSAVDINNTVVYNNITYHRLNMNTNTIIPLYVAVSQDIYDNGNNRSNVNFIPYATNNNAGTTVIANRMPTGIFCSENWTNTDDPFSCDRKTGILTLIQASSVSGRSGKIYFYMPKIPTSEIVFDNILIASTKIATAISTSSWDASRKVAEANVHNGNTIFQFYISGSIRFDNACKIEGPVAVEIPLGGLPVSAFTTQGGKPSNYTAKNISLSFKCTKDIPSTYGGMKWSISPTTASDGSGLAGVLVAKPASSNTISGLGVKVTHDLNGSSAIPLGSNNLQTAMITGTTAKASFYAFPTMINTTKPTGAGDYTATATVTFEVP